MAVVNVAFFAGTGDVSKNGGENMSEPSIVTVIPAEDALTGDSGLNDARASLALLAKAREALERSYQEQESISAYCAAWCLCLRIMQNSTDQTVRPFDGFDKLTADCAQGRQLIIDEWNKSLQEDSDLTPLQIYALSEQWDQRLLTDDFWQLLNKTNKRETVSAICYVLYEHGNAADIGQLMQNANPVLMWDFRKSYRTQLIG